MEDLVLTAKKLRAVRKACRHFLTLWALQEMVHEARAGAAPTGVPHGFDHNPYDRDWRAMYQGDLLDD